MDGGFLFFLLRFSGVWINIGPSKTTSQMINKPDLWSLDAGLEWNAQCEERVIRSKDNSKAAEHPASCYATPKSCISSASLASNLATPVPSPRKSFQHLHCQAVTRYLWNTHRAQSNKLLAYLSRQGKRQQSRGLVRMPGQTRSKQRH